MTVPTSTSHAAHLKKRFRREQRFKFYGILALGFSLFAMVALFSTIIGEGIGAFRQTTVQLEVTLDQALIDPEKTRNIKVLQKADYRTPVKKALRTLFPDVKKRKYKRELNKIISSGAAFDLRQTVIDNPQLVGTTIAMKFPMSADADLYVKSNAGENIVTTNSRVSPNQQRWIKKLQSMGRIETGFNTRFLTSGDSRNPELAGILGALMGSILTMAVTLALSFPIAVAAAVYLEEFASDNRFTRLIEVNINNLAAVPSIVFGLLGLSVFLTFFELPRSAPLVGGMVLALMTLPTIIIAARASLKAVPPSIRHAALGLGATKLQTVTHHVLPLALPGILTGTIIGMAQALGETAPLLMIGMVAFIVDIPGSLTDAATALPVQIYLWADSPERAFIEKTSGAIIVLLAFLISMNALAQWLRKKFEIKW